ncbi:MAG: hypothetical protein JWO22_1255 [Frankiales bacterium]|nr:hypothetical protein [Frankiales bacterium]
MYGYTPEEDRRQDPARRDAPVPERPTIVGLRWPSDDVLTAVTDGSTEAGLNATPASRIRSMLDMEGMHPHDAATQVMAESDRFDEVVEALVLDEEFNIDDWKVSPFTAAVMMACTLDWLHRVLHTKKVSWGELLEKDGSDATPASTTVSTATPVRTCTMRVIAEVEGSAQPVLDGLLTKWHPDFKETFTVTLGDAIGSQLRIQATYTAKGADSDHGAKRVRAAAESIGTTIVSLRNWSISDSSEPWEA